VKHVTLVEIEGEWTWLEETQGIQVGRTQKVACHSRKGCPFDAFILCQTDNCDKLADKILTNFIVSE
jgi:hypothetical protein